MWLGMNVPLTHGGVLNLGDGLGKSHVAVSASYCRQVTRADKTVLTQKPVLQVTLSQLQCCQLGTRRKYTLRLSSPCQLHFWLMSPSPWQLESNASLEGGPVYSGSRAEDTVHHGGEDRAAEAVICSFRKEAENEQEIERVLRPAPKWLTSSIGAPPLKGYTALPSCTPAGGSNVQPWEPRGGVSLQP